jgi:hypothetical protein
MPNSWSKLSLLFSLTLLVSLAAFGQNTPSINSPYSRYGIGNVNSTDFAALQSMGGISSAYNNPYQLNITNPASLSYLNYAVFETGAYAEYKSLSSQSTLNPVGNWSGNISHFALAFPLKNQLNRLSERKKSPFSNAMAFGLMPYSTIGYDIESSSVLPDIGQVTYQYIGEGGSYQAFLAASSKYKGLSIGGHLGYIFGNSRNERAVFFNDLDFSFTDVLREEYSMRGFTFRLGAQYEYIIGKVEEEDAKERAKRPRLTFGIHGNTVNSIDISGNSISARTSSFYTGSNLDTILSSVERTGTLQLPSELGVGVVYSKLMHWKIGVDYKMTNWSGYDNELNPENLENAWRAAIGGEYIPKYNSYNKYGQRLRYRAGFHYGTDPRVVSGEQLTNMGLTVGVGFPLVLPRGVPSFVNLGLEVGQLAAPDLISENYFKINVGFTLNDNTWFYKQKFN